MNENIITDNSPSEWLDVTLNISTFVQSPTAMKYVFKLILIVLFGFFFSSSIIAQDIPNSSFENWSGGNPVNWYSTNMNFLGFQFNVVNKETANPQSGLASARLEVVTKTIPFVGTYTVPGVLSLSPINIDLLTGTYNISGGYPFTAMPQQLSGFIKYHPVGTDTCYFGFALTKWNNGVRDTIGYSVDTVSGLVNDWTAFQLPIAYDIWEAPDTMSILFLCSNVNDPVVHTGTKLWIDNLSFIYGTVGIEGITFGKDYRIYADATSRQIRVETQFDTYRKIHLYLFDISGKLVESKEANMKSDIERMDTGHLPTGTYILKITDRKKILDSRKITLYQ
ncbi:MAG: T9SS type A sorting domain-containing protein [Bacteroidetes bacterium]|nr:T9SS type A sorting domain-containing protein [Bacteroidota bacterium]